MTADEPVIRSEAEFQSALQTLLRQASRNDVDIRGGWECREDDANLDLDVVVTEVRKAVDTS